MIDKIAGGVWWYCAGNWICSFAKYVGLCTVLEVELWGIMEGLCLCWDRGWRSINSHVDSKVAVTIIKGNQVERLASGGLVREIQKLLAFNWDVYLEQVFREVNRCDDTLASIGCNQIEFLTVFEQSPSSMNAFVLDDCNGFLTHRPG